MYVVADIVILEKKKKKTFELFDQLQYIERAVQCPLLETKNKKKTSEIDLCLCMYADMVRYNY